MKVLDRFRSSELERIRDAVERAELRTSGEIVTYIVGECDGYPESSWRGATLGAMAGMGLGLLSRVVPGFVASELWLTPFWYVVLPAVLGSLIGYLLGSRVPPIRRFLAHRDLITHRVGLRAESAFLEEEVFDTRERTGILIFIALLEHRVLVLGDSGINAAVEESEWREIIDHMVADLKRGRPVDALLHGVADCGKLLERHGVERRDDDRDELSNMPRLRDR